MIRSASLTLLASLLISVQPASAQQGRSVVLVLDASGSMNAKVPDGYSRIDAAKAAITDLVAKMDGATRLALRAYGHQSGTQARNCKDTARIVDFDRVSTNRDRIIAKATEIRARGYTPITYALTEAARDLLSEEGERVVVLVSDGQETCEADPCVAAKALAAADAKLVVHTIGFGVGAATRSQLQCIASVARGQYFDVSGTGALAAALGKAAATKAALSTQSTVTVKKAVPSYLAITNASVFHSHDITGEDGRLIKSISGAGARTELPPGIYSVKFENGVWRGVEIKAGETTTLELGTLWIEGGQSDLNGYTLLEPETRQVFAKGKVFRELPLIPARIIVSSGHLDWPELEIKPGERTVLNPARIEVKGDKAGTYTVTTEDGRPAGTVSRLLRLPLPPGKYVADVEGQRMAIELAEGQTHTITVE